MVAKKEHGRESAVVSKPQPGLAILSKIGKKGSFTLALIYHKICILCIVNIILNNILILKKNFKLKILIFYI